MSAVRIREALAEDVPGMLEIYGHYVRETAVTFEEETPSEEKFGERLRKITERYPWYVAEEDGRILGYAYAGPFHVRSAYRFSCEMTVYVDPDEKGRGLGRRLYETLETELKDRGYLNLYACIGHPPKEDPYLDRNSEEFHAHMGYRMIGRFRRCGFKFGRWYDMVWMEKTVGRHGRHPAEPRKGGSKE